jgi:DNA-binding response OmpR family regulator
MTSILIIEDDADIAELVKHALTREPGFRVRVESDGEAGLARARETCPDLILLDLNLPGIDGMEVCRQLRTAASTRAIPLIMLTARVAESKRVAGLDAGADDYVGKPFSIHELVARVRALLRRSRGDGGETLLVAGALEIDPAARRVSAHGAEVQLTRKEFDLLAELVRNRGRVLSRETLLDTVWGYQHHVTTRTVDVHVRQLRKKVGGALAEHIETVVGVGYRFRAEQR